MLWFYTHSGQKRYNGVDKTISGLRSLLLEAFIIYWLYLGWPHLMHLRVPSASDLNHLPPHLQGDSRIVQVPMFICLLK